MSGNRLPQTPTHQFIGTAEINLAASAVRTRMSSLRGDLAYESKRYSQVDNLNWAGDSYNLNASIGHGK